MRKIGIALWVATFLALVIIAVSNAFTASGQTRFYGGGAFGGARVTIFSSQHGSGATYSDANGNYSFGGLFAGTTYYLDASGCKAHTQYYAATQAYYGGTLPTLLLQVTGSC